MLFNFSKKNSGFTLIEAIVYVAVSSILLLVITRLGFDFFSSKQKILAQEEILENANVIINKMTQSVRDAQGIILPQTISQELSLQMKETSVNPTRFYATGESFYIAQGIGSGIKLNSGNVGVSSLQFEKITNNSVGIGIKINLTLFSLRNSIETSFSPTVSLR
jgi:type II secretory pathway pseudopilin PulG